MNKAVGRVAGIDGATTIAAFVHHGSIKADDLDVGAGFPFQLAANSASLMDPHVRPVVTPNLQTVVPGVMSASDASSVIVSFPHRQ